MHVLPPFYAMGNKAGHLQCRHDPHRLAEARQMSFRQRFRRPPPGGYKERFPFSLLKGLRSAAMVQERDG